MRPTSPPHDSHTFAAGPLVLAALILVAALTRLLPHPPNFSPIGAIALFGGAHFARRGWAIAVPLLALLVSDLALGLLHGALDLGWTQDTRLYVDYLLSGHSAAIYACSLLSVLLGFGLRGRARPARVLGFGIASAVAFFLTSNLVAWLLAVPGEPCTTGLGACYLAGLPFFQWTLAGTLFYAAPLFGGFALLRRGLPALRPQTV
ncbi:DUF6580 family putative transport protein [Coralloluteibacterium stylophorae]|uniref:Uncharacterized protein n=1 Tax=Coralloluteibacterium stylophorae TaxID=1776034 RepID=A0A8J7VU35_9GAMM|nr:DUF6580 family putative transport protein [Coralloluteibacterium stylophorae]MBS7456125.1 hypothetical protein [Coralloluteibacterium stylophorae]